MEIAQLPDHLFSLPEKHSKKAPIGLLWGLQQICFNSLWKVGDAPGKWKTMEMYPQIICGRNTAFMLRKWYCVAKKKNDGGGGEVQKNQH